MAEIILMPQVEDKLYSLAELLFKKGYFSFIDNANDYVNNLYDFLFTLPDQKHYHTKRPNHGRYYARYKANSHTTYYITFDTDGQRYLIKNIFSNHQPQYPRYIKGI